MWPQVKKWANQSKCIIKLNKKLKTHTNKLRKQAYTYDIEIRENANLCISCAILLGVAITPAT